jgi:endonuclease/exonuclease/phosphatase family metal-dependent hydrolase
VRSAAVTPRVKVATYNVHKCRGLDRRVLPARIAEVLREADADVIALQEVVSLENGRPEEDQARYLADVLGMEVVTGPNRRLGPALYGNAVLSRLPMRAVGNHDITVEGRERRGCLHIDISPPGGQVLHVFSSSSDDARRAGWWTTPSSARRGCPAAG